MKEQLVYKSIVKHVKKNAVNTCRISPGYNEEMIHNLRTDFKKSRAMLRWFLGEQLARRINKPFKKIYLAAGNIRNHDVLLEWYSNTTLQLPFFEAFIYSGRMKCVKQWEKIFNKEAVKKWHKKVREVRKWGKTNELFFLEKRDQLQVYLKRKQLSDMMMHEIRKILKDVQYLFDWIKEHKPEEISIFKHIPVEQLKYITTRLGKYNDLCFLIQSLLRYLQKQTDKEAFAVLRQCKKERITEKRHLLATLKNHFR